MSSPSPAGSAGDLSPFPVTRPSVQYLFDFRPPKHIGRGFSAQTRLDDLSLSGKLAKDAANVVLNRGIRAAVTAALEAFEEGRRALGRSPATIRVERVVRTPSRLTVDFSWGLSKHAAEGIVTEALSNLGLAVRGEIAIRSVNDEGVALVRARVLKASISFANESQPQFKRLLASHVAVSYAKDGFIVTPDGRRFDGLPGILNALPSAMAQAVLMAFPGSGSGIIDDQMAALRTPQEVGRFSDQLRDELETHVPGTLRELANLSLEHVLEAGLCVLEALHRQRDAWATHRLALDDSVFGTPTTRWVALNPDALWVRMHPGESKSANWRAQTFRVLQAMAAFEQSEAQGRSLGRRRCLLTAALDGRRLANAAFGQSSELAVALRDAGLKSCKYFFIAIDPGWANTLMPHLVDAAGEVAWGAGAVKAIKEQRASGKGEIRLQQIKRLERDVATRNYFKFDPALLVLGRHAGCSNESQRLLLSVLSEISPVSRPDGTRGKATAAWPPKDRTRSLANIAAVEDPNSDLFAGRWGHGYRILTWLSKCGYNPTPDKPTPRMLREFLGDIATLHEVFGLTIESAGLEGDTRAIIERLFRLARRRRGWMNAILKFRLPKDRGDDARERLRSAGIEGTGKVPNKYAHELVSNGALLLLRRQEVNLTQGDVARWLEVSEATVSYWETGKRPIPERRKHALSELLFGGQEWAA